VALKVRYGQLITLDGTDASRVRAHGPDGQLLALLTRVESGWKPDKVFDWT
jgi:hypothetical protein